mmetsp:Transcript_36010/g.41587  ORF Transcript_36010/g.41587 Transcript_36010/m.41587 type:complete len:99 (+) Transcript_36010:1088-1384(+)
MLFLVKVAEFTQSFSKPGAKNASKYRKFIEALPSKGLAPARLLLPLPNYSNNIRNGWKDLLLVAKEHLEKSISIIKTECIFGEFGLDPSDSAFNLAEV